MKFKNEGTIERTLRITIGLILIYWGYSESGEYWSSFEPFAYQIPCWVWENFMSHGCLIERGFAFAAIGFIPFLTGLIGWCPLNSFFRINTCKK